MLDRHKRFFSESCSHGHSWNVFGDASVQHNPGLGGNVLIFTYASVLDAACPMCGETGDLRLPNPQGYDVYCWCTCKRCTKTIYSAMVKDSTANGKVNDSLKTWFYRFPKGPALLCHACVNEIKQQEMREEETA